MSSAADAMQTLTSQWYNALVTQLHLDPSHFQLVQGNIGLGSTSVGMWALMDSIPPLSVTQYWTPQGYKPFSSQYGAVIPRLKDASYGQFQSAMGDYYNAWMAYIKANPAPTGTGILTWFQAWSQGNMPPDQAATALSLYAAALNGPIAQADIAWAIAGGATGVKAFNQTISQVDATLETAPSATVSLNSSTETSDTTHTWASGSVEGFWDVFFGEGGASYDASTSVVTSAGLAFDIQFTHVTTIPIIPLQQGAETDGPITYSAWYVPAALSEGYENNNYQVWQPGTPDWTSFFGDGGSLPRAAAAMIIVDGITLSLTSEAAIATESREEVKTSFAAGFFPFFGVNGEGGWSSDQKFNDSGQITATASNPVGSPQVLGILQMPIASLISSIQIQAARRSVRSPAALAMGSLEHSAEVAVPGGDATLLGIVHVAWTPGAIAGLANFPGPAGVKTVIANTVNTWATNSGPGWAAGSVHQYVGLGFVATAQVVAVNGPDRTINIIAFV
jgi:hypothetical protein